MYRNRKSTLALADISHEHVLSPIVRLYPLLDVRLLCEWIIPIKPINRHAVYFIIKPCCIANCFRLSSIIFILVLTTAEKLAHSRPSTTFRFSKREVLQLMDMVTFMLSIIC